MKPQRHRSLRLKVLLVLAIVAVATGYRAKTVDPSPAGTNASTSIAAVDHAVAAPAR